MLENFKGAKIEISGLEKNRDFFKETFKLNQCKREEDVTSRTYLLLTILRSDITLVSLSHAFISSHWSQVWEIFGQQKFGKIDFEIFYLQNYQRYKQGNAITMCHAQSSITWYNNHSCSLLFHRDREEEGRGDVTFGVHSRSLGTMLFALSILLECYLSAPVLGRTWRADWYMSINRYKTDKN